jgi:hypothetical protein
MFGCPVRNDNDSNGLSDHQHPADKPEGAMVHRENGSIVRGELNPPKGLLDTLLGLMGPIGVVGGGGGILGLGMAALGAYRKYQNEKKVNLGMIEAHDHWIDKQEFTDKEKTEHLDEYRDAHIVAGVRDEVKQRLKIHRETT